MNTVRGQVTAGLVNDVGVLDVQAVREVSPYGVEESSSGAFETAYHFTGEPRDANGLSYLRARYLNSELGIFASLDPIEFINRYTYVSDNPINFADPLGLFDTTTCTVEYGDYLEKIAIEHGICVLPASPEGMQRLEFSPNCPRGWGAVTNRSYNQDKINAWRRIGNLNPHLESPSLIYPGVRLFLPSNRDQVCEYRLAPIPDELVYVPPRPPVCDEYVDFPVLHGFTTPRSLPRSPATPVPIPPILPPIATPTPTTSPAEDCIANCQMGAYFLGGTWGNWGSGYSACVMGCMLAKCLSVEDAISGIRSALSLTPLGRAEDAYEAGNCLLAIANAVEGVASGRLTVPEGFEELSGSCLHFIEQAGIETALNIYNILEIVTDPCNAVIP